MFEWVNLFNLALNHFLLLDLWTRDAPVIGLNSFKFDLF